MRWAELRKFVIPAGVALFAALAVTFAVRDIEFLSNAERFVGDIETAALLPSQPQSPDVVIVGITEDTLKQFPYREPIDRQFLAALLSKIAADGPRAIGLDVLLDQPTEPAKDAALRQAIGTLPVPLVVSYIEDREIVDDKQRAFLDDFVPETDRVFADQPTDAQNGTARWIYPGRQLSDGTYIYGFARGILAKLGIRTSPEQVEIAWRGRPNADTEPFREFPAHLIGVLPGTWFKDKVVLIGADLSLTDRHRTPFAAVYPGNRGIIPGITIHAHAIDQLLTGRQSPQIGALSNFLIALMLAACGTLLGLSKLDVLPRIGVGFFLAVLFWASGFALFHYANTQVALITPSFSLALAMWGSDALTGREQRRQKEFIQGKLGQYVSPKVVDRLMLDPTKLSLEGERREMTFIFTDVAGFTTMSEAIAGHDLVQVVNAYLEGVCQVILKYDGTVDKFIGDAVFAIFNAPADQPDHAERAVGCALEIDQFAERFRAEQNAKGIPFGLTRIGVHSGVATIGDFGSQLKAQYTAVGDSVNTASRLEGLNKYFGTRVCASEEVRVQCPETPFRPIGMVVVKGKTQAIAMYEPLTEERARTAYIFRYGEAYRSLEEGSPEALAMFDALYVENPYDGVVEIHLERLRQGVQGVEIAMTEK